MQPEKKPCYAELNSDTGNRTPNSQCLYGSIGPRKLAVSYTTSELYAESTGEGGWSHFKRWSDLGLAREPAQKSAVESLNQKRKTVRQNRMMKGTHQRFGCEETNPELPVPIYMDSSSNWQASCRCSIYREFKFIHTDTDT
jgi:hypothetical protein